MQVGKLYKIGLESEVAPFPEYFNLLPFSGSSVLVQIVHVGNFLLL